MHGRGSKIWIVELNLSTIEVTCICKKFELMDIPYSHALKALSLKNVNRIPERYIMKWWPKEEK